MALCGIPWPPNSACPLTTRRSTNIIIILCSTFHDLFNKLNEACLWRPEVFDLKASDAFFTMGTMSGGASWMARASVVLNNLAPPAIQSLN